MIFSGMVFLYKTLENKYPSVTQLMDKVIVFFFSQLEIFVNVLILQGEAEKAPQTNLALITL